MNERTLAKLRVYIEQIPKDPSAKVLKCSQCGWTWRPHPDVFHNRVLTRHRSPECRESRMIDIGVVGFVEYDTSHLALEGMVRV